MLLNARRSAGPLERPSLLRAVCAQALTLLCAAAFATGLFACPPSACAGQAVALPDPHLRAAVARVLVDQGTIPRGSDGTTISPEAMARLVALSVPHSGVADLSGLGSAVNLISLDVSGNCVRSLAPLAGLARLAKLDASRNLLDLSAGTPDAQLVAALTVAGVAVTGLPQSMAISAPAFASGPAITAHPVAFSATIAPASVCSSAAVRVVLQSRVQRVEQRVSRGRVRRVTITRWRTASVRPAVARTLSGLKVTLAVPSAGTWRVRVVMAASDDREGAVSEPLEFAVSDPDPRIEAAIAWALRRVGWHRWDHYCLRFCGDAYDFGAGATVKRYSSAHQAAVALHAASRLRTPPPRGAYVFFDSRCGGANLGHVGISLGDGTMVNDYGSRGVRVQSIAGTHERYIGWAPPPVTPPITDWSR